MHLVGRYDDDIDQHTRHQHPLRLEGAAFGQPLHLSNDQATIVANGERLIERTEIAALVLVGQVAALVRRGGANDGDVGNDGGEEQPAIAGEGNARDDGFGGGAPVHGAAFPLGIDKGIEPDLGDDAGPLGRGLSVHVEKDARGDVVSRNCIAGDHPPDGGGLGRGRPGRIGAGEHLGEQTFLGKVVDALDAVHVAGGDRVQRRQPPRMPGTLEAAANGREHGIRTAEARG